MIHEKKERIKLMCEWMQNENIEATFEIPMPFDGDPIPAKSHWHTFERFLETYSWKFHNIIHSKDFEIRTKPSKLDECVEEITSNPSFSWDRGHRSDLKHILAKYIPGEEC